MERILKSARESGSLNLSNRSLSEVPGEVYNNLDTGSLDDKWWEGVDLQKLILAHNNLEVIREDLRNLSSLVVLNISHNQLSSIPAAIGDLSLLKSLDVSFNQIKLIPEEVGLATALVKFIHSLESQLPKAARNGSISPLGLMYEEDPDCMVEKKLGVDKSISLKLGVLLYKQYGTTMAGLCSWSL